MSNRLTSLKSSLKKMLASFICLLLVNAALSCWQQVAAQPQKPSYSSLSFLTCHQTEVLNVGSNQTHHGSGLHLGFKKNQPDQQQAAGSFSTGSHHQCALSCALFTAPADISQQVILIENPLRANKAFYLTATPLKAWLRDLERPPQFLS